MTTKHTTWGDDLRGLMGEYRADLGKAESYKNDHLSGPGLLARRKELRDQVKATYVTKIGQLAGKIDSERHQIVDKSTKAIPEAKVSTRDFWEKAKMLIDAGKPLPKVIADADGQMLAGIQEWGPTFLEARAIQRNSEGTPSPDGLAGERERFDRSVKARWAELLPDDLGSAVRAELDTEAEYAGANTLLKYYSDGIARGRTGDGMSADMEAHYAAQEATQTLTD